MTGQEHTPGPWRWGSVEVSTLAMGARFTGLWPADMPEDLGIMLAHEAADLIASKCILREDDDPETRINEANANLIAAAPDLLEAAEAALEDRIGWRRMMRAALAKARGE